jgi:hypothetical protein
MPSDKELACIKTHLLDLSPLTIYRSRLRVFACKDKREPHRLIPGDKLDSIYRRRSSNQRQATELRFVMCGVWWVNRWAACWTFECCGGFRGDAHHFRRGHQEGKVGRNTKSSRRCLPDSISPRRQKGVKTGTTAERHLVVHSAAPNVVMDYTCPIWRSAGLSHVRKLPVLQQFKCVRVATNAPLYVCVM